MTPYLNLRCDYFDHPKTKRLIGLLGKGAEVLPIRLWAYCGMFHAKDGKLSGYAEQEIESLANWWGKAGALLPAMEQIGFMHKARCGSWSMSDWNEHQGHIEALKIRARKAAKTRWDNYRRNATGNAQALRKQCSDQPADLPRSGGGKKKVARAKIGGFPVPKGEALPSPLYKPTAEAMIEACRKQISEIRAKARKVPVHGTTGEGTKVVMGHEIEPEAKQAIELWRDREREITRALAG